MRTRRSPRNQMRLWRELGGTPAKPQPRTDADRVEGLQWALQSPYLSPRAKRQIERDIAAIQRRAAIAKAGGRS